MPKNNSEILEKYIHILLRKQYNIVVKEYLNYHSPFKITTNNIILPHDISYNDLYETLNTADLYEIKIHDITNIPFRVIGLIDYQPKPYSDDFGRFTIIEATIELIDIFKETENLYNMGVLSDYAA